MPFTILPGSTVFEDYRFGWWNEKLSPFKYPYVFISAASHMPYGNIRKFNIMDDDVILYSDSGGFSLIGEVKKLNAYEVADWYNISGIDFGFILDLPPTTSKLKTTLVDFDASLEATVMNAKVMRDRVKDRVKLYAVIHGIDERTMKKWFDAINMVGDWFGYAFSGNEADPNTLFRMIKFIEDYVDREKPVHFLAFGRRIVTLLLSRWAKKTGRVVTADFTTMTTMALKHWEFHTPIGRVKIGTEKRDRVGEKVFCLCPVCKRYGEKVFKTRDLFILHNLYFLLWTYGVIDSISLASPEALAVTIQDRSYGETSDLVRKLDSLIEKKGGLAEYV